MEKQTTSEKFKVDGRYAGKRLLNVRETARFLGIAERTLLNRTGPKAKNPFPVRPKRVGRSVRFDIRDLEAFVEKL